jgi:nitrate/nitrite-specific signal transduction histidine kinase
MSLMRLKCFLETESIFFYIYIKENDIKMAKKTKVKNNTTNVNIDALVNEGKNINETDVNETWAKIAEEVKESTSNGAIIDSDVSTLYESDAKVEETESVQEDNTDFVQSVQNSDNEPSEKTEIQDTTVSIEENIDDIIAECTGESEKVEVEQKKEIKDNEPWYVARALRGNDYFNW